MCSFLKPMNDNRIYRNIYKKALQDIFTKMYMMYDNPITPEDTKSVTKHPIFHIV